MKAFFKKYSYIVVKCLINQIAIAFFGVSLAFALTDLKSLLTASSVFAIVFYLFLLYTVIWEVGAKDGIRSDAGHEKKRPLTGLYIGLIANIPNIIIAILSWIGYIFGSTEGMFAYEWAGNMFAVVTTIGRFFEGMYLGLLTYFNGNTLLQAVSFTVMIIPALFIMTFGYIIGTKNFKISSIFGLKYPEKSNKK